VDRDFAQSKAVFVLYVADTESGSPALYGPATVDSRAIVLEGIRAGRGQDATMRIGADGKLYVALDSGDDARRGPSGKVLRVNVDGTTPEDQPPGSLTILDGLAEPVE